MLPTCILLLADRYVFLFYQYSNRDFIEIFRGYLTSQINWLKVLFDFCYLSYVSTDLLHCQAIDDVGLAKLKWAMNVEQWAHTGLTLELRHSPT